MMLARLAAVAVGCLLLGAPGARAAEFFDEFVAGRALATTTLGATDTMPVIQGGQTRRLFPQSYFMRPDASNATLPVVDNAGTGILVGDGGVLTVKNRTATNAFSVYGGVVPAGYFYNDVIRAVVDLRPGTTATSGSAYGAYVLNNNAHGTGANFGVGVGYFSQSIAAVDDAKVWGANFTLVDNLVNTPITSSGRTLVGIENDWFINGAGTSVQGISQILNGTAQPAGANANQVSIASGSTAKWTNGYITDNGATTATGAAAIFGALAVSGTSVASQPLKFGSFDSGSAGFYTVLDTLDHKLRYTDNTLAHGISLGASATDVTIAPNGTGNSDLLLTGLGSGIVRTTNQNLTSPTIGAAAGTSLALTGFLSAQGGQAVLLGGAGAVYPASGTTSYAIGSNFTNGPREVDFWNVDTAATTSFNFYQKTAASAATLVASMLPNGTVTFGKMQAGGALAYPTAVPRIYGSGNASGTTGGGVQAYYVLNTNSDTADCTSAGGCYNAYLGNAFGGAAVKGNRTGTFAFMNMTATTGNTAAGNYYTALGSESRASANDNGTAPAPRGSVFGFNTTARLESGATFFNSLVGDEIDVSADAGSSVAYKGGLSLVQLATDANRGSIHDAAFLIANQHSGTAPGWLNGITFGGPTGWWPMASTGSTMIGTSTGFAGGPAYEADFGIDFSAVTFATAFLKSTGFSVDGSGITTVAKLEAGGAPPTGALANAGASIHLTADQYNGLVLDKSGGGTNPMTLALGVNQASLYTEIQSAANGLSTAPLWLNRQGGQVRFGSTGPAHITSGQTTPPALTSCGTGSPTNTGGTDTAGTITFGTTATGCVITFNVAYTGTPHCVVSWQATPLLSQSYTVSNTAITLTQTATSGNKVNYHCIGLAGG